MSAPRTVMARDTVSAQGDEREVRCREMRSRGRMANSEVKVSREGTAAAAETRARRWWRGAWCMQTVALLALLAVPSTGLAASERVEPKATPPAGAPSVPALASGLTPGAPLEAPAIVEGAHGVAPTHAEIEEVQGGGSPSETVEFYAYDAIGSVRVVFDTAGTVVGQATYSPFGQEIAGTAGVPAQRFTGQERDHEAQLDYFNARQFQPRTGRFGTVDPVWGGGADPQRWNRYAYALNNPLSFTDPTGLLADGDDNCVGYDFETLAAGVTCKIGKSQPTMAQQYSGPWTGGAWSGGLGGNAGRPAGCESFFCYDPENDLDVTPQQTAIPNPDTDIIGTATGVTQGIGAGAAVGGTAAATIKVGQALGLVARAVIARFALEQGPKVDWSRAGHIFRDANGHVNPTSILDKARYANLFESVAAQRSNLRPDLLTNPHMIRAGVNIFMKEFQRGQVWVHVRDGKIENAGVNQLGAFR